jgi:Domain of unknown function (DUF6894)
MPRYFFHVRDDGQLFEDIEGIELPDIPDVEAWLLKAASEVLSEAEWQKERTEGRSFEVVDEKGQIVLIVPFGDLQADS